MDDKITAYFEALVLDVLRLPQYANLPDDIKSQVADKVRDHFNNIVFDTVISKLSMEQLQVLKSIPMDSPQMQDKVEEYSTQIPFLADTLETVLTQEVEKIKQNPGILNNP